MAMTISGTGGVTFPDTTVQVSAAVASTAYGGVGSYATLLNLTTTTTYTAGATDAGASLSVSCPIRSSAAQTANTTTAPSGTWRIMSLYNNNVADKSILVGLWVRIA